jgi:hypothetical protein
MASSLNRLGWYFEDFQEKFLEKPFRKRHYSALPVTVQIAVSIVLSKAKNVSLPVTIIIF